MQVKLKKLSQSMRAWIGTVAESVGNVGEFFRLWVAQVLLVLTVAWMLVGLITIFIRLLVVTAIYLWNLL